jgi:hypothetical protein
MSAYLSAPADVSEAVIAATWTRLSICAENTAGKYGPRRQGRASAITNIRRRFEREHNVRLVLLSRSYSETRGFLHRSTFTFAIENGEKR